MGLTAGRQHEQLVEQTREWILVVGERVRSVVLCPVRNEGYRSSQIVQAVARRAERASRGDVEARGPAVAEADVGAMLTD